MKMIEVTLKDYEVKALKGKTLVIMEPLVVIGQGDFSYGFAQKGQLCLHLQ
jgi:hypothetical protein